MTEASEVLNKSLPLRGSTKLPILVSVYKSP